MIPTGHWLNYVLGGVLVVVVFALWFWYMQDRRDDP